ncbi:MAG: TonB family protein [Campylobacterota bacterium]|nr:TonB family protein [Campylobacterota bacterium]
MILLYFLMLKFIYAFFITIIAHIILYIFINDLLSQKELKINTTNKIIKSKKSGYTNIKYVKLQKVKKATEYKNKKIVIKKEIESLQIPIKKEKVDLKKFFTIDKSKVVKKEKKKTYQKNEDIIKEVEEIKHLDKLTQSYIKLYGEEYFAFSKEQKKYLKTNLSKIGQITQRYLSYPGISIQTRQSGINTVEFLFHPNGDISNLRITDSSQYTALDQNTIQTIKTAYKDYPRANEAVKIKIYVRYIMY